MSASLRAPVTRVLQSTEHAKKINDGRFCPKIEMEESAWTPLLVPKLEIMIYACQTRGEGLQTIMHVPDVRSKHFSLEVHIPRLSSRC